VHFVHIALDGYTSDQQSAFLPGLPALRREPQQQAGS
jgi:hypothetical protein